MMFSECVRALRNGRRGNKVLQRVVNGAPSHPFLTVDPRCGVSQTTLGETQMKKTLIVTALSAAFAVLAPFASAETDTTADLSAQAPIVVAQAGQPQAGQGQRQHREFQLPSQRIEARLAAAKAQLKITDAQNTLWENFAGVMRNQARAMDQHFQERKAKWEAAKAQGVDPRAQRPQVSAIQRLELRQQRLQEASARLNDVLAAAKPLYASFSPEQKQIADTLLAKGGHGHGHHMHQRGQKPAA
jgi:hypothetical protein